MARYLELFKNIFKRPVRELHCPPTPRCAEFLISEQLKSERLARGFEVKAAE